MVDTAVVVASIVAASRVSPSIIGTSIVASMVVAMRHRENRNRLVEKSMPLPNCRVLRAFSKKNREVGLNAGGLSPLFGLNS